MTGECEFDWFVGVIEGGGGLGGKVGGEGWGISIRDGGIIIIIGMEFQYSKGDCICEGV